VSARFYTITGVSPHDTPKNATLPGPCVAQGYELSLNRYKETVHDEVEHRSPLEIIADIEVLDEEITKGLAELKAMLS